MILWKEGWSNMTNEVYKQTKLAIFEKAADGEITESQRDDLLLYLEEKKEETELTPDKIEDFFDELEEKYPDLEDDIKKLSKKIEKSGDSSKSDDDEDDDNDGEDDESADEKEEGCKVSEAALDLMDKIDIFINDLD